MKNTKIKKILKLATNVLTYGFIVLCAALIFASFTMKKSTDDALTLFGYQARIIQSDSMEKSELTDVSGFQIKSIKVKSLVFIETVPEDEAEAKAWFAELKVGDVLTFRYVYNGQVTITHRIVAIEDNENGRILTLEGDNKTGDSQLMRQTLDTSRHFDPTCYNYTIGKVTGQSYAIGVLVYAMNTPVGMFCIVVIPCVIIIIMEIVRIINVLGEDKRKKAKAEAEEKEAEIERLKSRLAALQAGETEAAGMRSDTEIEMQAPAPSPEKESEATPETENKEVDTDEQK